MSDQSHSFTNMLNPHQHLAGKPTITGLCKTLAISVLVIYLTTIIYIQFGPSWFQSSPIIFINQRQRGNNPPDPTNIGHIAFGIASSSRTWKSRRSYAETWWQPNVTRGYLFLDKVRRDFFPWSALSPPYKISEDTSMYKTYDKHKTKQAIRMVRMILETFRAENEGVRWYVMLDDDTIIFVNNLVDVLGKYDHRDYLYLGASSESLASNYFFSSKMAFGGGGYALSYPLAEALVKNFDGCIKRYPKLYGSDHIVYSCVADLGVSMTREKGFHQVDLHGDISGFLSSHPQTPLVSLHHFDVVDPIFPSMNRLESLHHLMKASKADDSRMLQQTICYNKQFNWTFSISWGYSVHIYHYFVLPSMLVKPLETFIPWTRFSRPPYTFNTRFLPNYRKNPCQAPHVFFFDSVDDEDETTGQKYDHIATTYNRTSPPRKLPACSPPGYVSPGDIDRVLVTSPTYRYNHQGGGRRECCDIVPHAAKTIAHVKLRACLKHEITSFVE